MSEIGLVVIPIGPTARVREIHSAVIVIVQSVIALADDAGDEDLDLDGVPAEVRPHPLEVKKDDAWGQDRRFEGHGPLSCLTTELGGSNPAAMAAVDHESAR